MNVNDAYQLVIYDVDGTLVRTKSGETFRKTADDWELIDGVLTMQAQIHAAAITCALASNQGGVAFGHYEFGEMETSMLALAEQLGIEPRLVEWEPTHPHATVRWLKRASPYRKPGGRMLTEILHACGVPAAQALMVGDRPEDHGAANAAGVAWEHPAVFFSLTQPGVLEAYLREKGIGTEEFPGPRNVGECTDCNRVTRSVIYVEGCLARPFVCLPCIQKGPLPTASAIRAWHARVFWKWVP